MKNILTLILCLFFSGCATEPTPNLTKVSSEQALPKLENHSALLEKIKIGMPRAETESILGEPTSVTETATGITDVWIFATGSSDKALPKESVDNSAFYSQIGSIAATTAGIFIPYAGVIGTIGSQVYSVSNANDQNAPKPTQTGTNTPLVVTIEFRDNKVFSIQKANPAAIPLTPAIK